MRGVIVVLSPHNRAPVLGPPRTRGPRSQARYRNLAAPPRPRGNGNFASITSPNSTTTPAKAGAQLGTVALVDAAPRYLDLSNRAPASAGVVPNDVVDTGSVAVEEHI